MIDAVMQKHNVLAGAVKRAFHNWASRDVKYKRVYEKTPQVALEIVDDAIDDLQHLTPCQFDLWWALNHMKYRKRVFQQDARLANELAYHFLTKYVRGELADATQPTPRKKRR